MLACPAQAAVPAPGRCPPYQHRLTWGRSRHGASLRLRLLTLVRTQGEQKRAGIARNVETRVQQTLRLVVHKELSVPLRVFLDPGVVLRSADNRQKSLWRSLQQKGKAALWLRMLQTCPQHRPPARRAMCPQHHPPARRAMAPRASRRTQERVLNLRGLPSEALLASAGVPRVCWSHQRWEAPSSIWARRSSQATSMISSQSGASLPNALILPPISAQPWSWALLPVNRSLVRPPPRQHPWKHRQHKTIGSLRALVQAPSPAPKGRAAGADPLRSSSLRILLLLQTRPCKHRKTLSLQGKSGHSLGRPQQRPQGFPHGSFSLAGTRLLAGTRPLARTQLLHGAGAGQHLGLRGRRGRRAKRRSR